MSTHPWQSEPVLVFTADMDWASEPALRISHTYFADVGAKVTYFMTNPSDFLSARLVDGAIDAGIHPNFLPGSSHGDSIPEVMDYCCSLLPEATCFRSHRYFDVTDISHGLYDRGYRYDANVCTFLQKGVRRFRHESGLIRFPTYFEDGTYLYHRQSLVFDKAAENLFMWPGIQMISVHPMHMVMNSPDLPYSRRVKNSVSWEAWNAMDEATCAEIRHDGRGIRDFVLDLLHFVNKRNIVIMTLAEVYTAIKDTIEHALTLTGQERICTAGGTFMNCKMNGVLARQVGLSNYFVQPAAGDNSIALGAALAVAGGRGRRLRHLYTGPEFDDATIEAALKGAAIDYARADDGRRKRQSYWPTPKCSAGFRDAWKPEPAPSATARSWPTRSTPT